MTQKTLRLAHISDLHFGRTDPDVVNGLRDYLNDAMPDVVIVGGDITQGARPHEFREARAFFDSLAPETLVVPGNHDLPGWAVWWRFLDGYGRYRRHVGPDLDQSLVLDQGVIVGLNSARRVIVHWDWSNGVISDRQLDYADEALGGAHAAGFRIVVFHHPLVPPLDRPRQKLVGNAAHVARRLAEAQTDLVLTGHLHTQRSRLITDHFPHTPWSFPVVQTATSTSTRLRGGEQNGVSLITLAGQTMTVDAFAWAGQAFEALQTERFEQNPGQGWRALLAPRRSIGAALTEPKKTQSNRAPASD